MDEQRRQILQMLAEGKITAEEAERLIDAVERERPEYPERPERPERPEPPAETASRPRKSLPKYLRVLVEDPSSYTTSGEPSRVNVRVPLKLLLAGVKLTSLIPPKAMERINAELDKNGVPIDLTRLKPQDLEELVEQIDEVTVNIDDPSGKVQVFCE